MRHRGGGGGGFGGGGVEVSPEELFNMFFGGGMNSNLGRGGASDRSFSERLTC